MKEWIKLSIITVAGLLIVRLGVSFFTPKPSFRTLMGATGTFPPQGGTGIFSVTTSDIGKVYAVSSSNPYVLKLVTQGSGNGTIVTGTPGQFPYYAATGTTLTPTTQLFQTPGGQITIGTTTVAATNPPKVFIDTGTSTSEELLDAFCNVNDFCEITTRNSSTGTSAQSGFQALPDIGNNTTSFMYMGVNNSGYSNSSPFNIGFALDSNILSLTGHDLYLANGSAGANIFFTTGGTSSTNRRGTVTSNGLWGFNTTTPQSRVTILGTGTENPFDVVSSTGSSIFRVLTNSRVGINSTSPIAALGVVGNIAFSGGLFDSNGTLGSNGQVLQTNGTVSSWVSTSTLGFSNNLSGLAGQVAYYSANGTTVAGTSSVFIASNNNVGIGTTTPQAVLTVQGNDGILAFNVISSTFGSMLSVLSNGNVGINSSTPTASLGIQAVATKDAFDIVSSTGGGLMVQIDPSGNINIGTNPIDQVDTIGNATGVTSVVVNCGTGNCNFGSNATDHSTNIGSASGASNLTLQSGNGAMNLSVNATSNGIQASGNSETGGTVMTVKSSATSMSSGGVLLVNKTGASGSTAYTGSIFTDSYTQTWNGGTNLINTGVLANFTRTLTMNNATKTMIQNGAVMTISDNYVVTTGTFNSGADVLDVTQNYASNTGTALNVVDLGTGIGFSVSSTKISFVGLGTNGITGNLLCWNSTTGAVSQEAASCTVSSARFKDHIESLSSDKLAEIADKLRPVTYIEKKTGKQQYGLIAEEVAMLDPMFVIWTGDYKPSDLAFEKKNYPNLKLLVENGKTLIPQGVDYERLPIIYAAAYQSINKRVTDLENKNVVVEHKITIFEKFMNLIKPLINAI